jgi:hypothetical protein
MKRIALVICLAGLCPILWAAGISTGTWVRRANKDGMSSTMFVEAAGTGQKLTLKVRVGDGTTSTMNVTTQWDGKDAPLYVDGKPSGETMAIRMVDDRHITTIIKTGGKPIATQKSEVSADGKVIKTETIHTTPEVQNTVEYWDKK